MQFKRLRLAGFKSFVDPTEFWIEPGLTGVVGPNGCGKSNVLEAIRWVMGESSPKSMRGSGMDDVIFAGTDSRPARNVADVALLLDNRDRRAPAAFNDADEIEVSRRIERELGSVYRVNGKDVRLKDVQLLFADAATGAHSPALVSQNRVGALINAKPQQRRQLLEEAAGISGLHARRKEAEQRLRAAEGNLTRLADVMQQMEGQAAALKRQARQAERYRQISADIRVAEGVALYARWRGESEKLAAVEKALREAEAQVADLTAQTTALSRQQLAQSEGLPPLREAEAQAAAALTRLVLAREELDKEEARLAATQAQLKERLTQAVDDLAREAAMQADSQAALARLQGEGEALEATIAAAAANHEAAAAKVRAAETAASEAEGALDAASRALANAEARRETLAGAGRAAARRLERIEAERLRLSRERQNLRESDALGQSVAAAEANLEAAEVRLEQAGAAVDQQGGALTRAEEARDAAQSAHQDAEAQARRLGAEIKALDDVLDAGGGQAGGARPVAEAVSVAQGYEVALGAALGDDIEAPVGEGPRHWQDLGGMDQAADLPAEVRSLAAHVEAPAALHRRLSQTGLVDAPPSAAMLAALAPGQCLVDRAGALWRWDGFVAAADAPSAASVRLAQRNRRAALAQDHEAAQAKAAAAADTLAQARDAVREAARALDAARQAEKAVNQEIGALRRDVARLTQDHAQRQSRVGAIDNALARLDGETTEAEAEQAAATQALADLPALDALSAQVDGCRVEAGARRAELVEARSAFDRLNRELSASRDRLQAVQREHRQWHQRIEAAQAQREKLESRRHEAESALASLAERPAVIAAQRADLMDRTQAAEQQRQQAADRLAQAEQAVAALDRQAKALNETLTQARERRVRLDAERQSHGERQHEVAQVIGQNFSCAPPLLLQQIGVDEPEELPPLNQLDAKLEKLKAERERLGAVNLRAEIELQELTDQLNHLEAEKSDLESAIARLRAGIGSLNREGRERLLAAFAEVNAHFGDLFKTLFGGGQAHLELIESDDPLEAGLEIMASPPGKRLQTLSLLSGGEQALTALSLIFAVFMTNPAPICVLDEVDAPLDDANVERFCNLLDEMTQRTETRFLIVTHNAVTMSRMDRLFGVTMAERGVSQLVSVDLASAEELRAAE